MNTIVQFFIERIKRIHRIVSIIEPWSILIAVVGIFFSVFEINEARAVREATLFAMASELLQKAREIDEDSGEPSTALIGQVRILEIMARDGISIEGINARETRIDDAQLADTDFRNANFWGASFLGTDLSRADLENTILSNAVLGPSNSTGCIHHTDLSRADLTKSQLLGARLVYVNLAYTNLEDAILERTKLLGVDLRDVKGLTKEQIKKACGEEVQLPKGWSINPCNTDTKAFFSRIKLISQMLPICDG